MAIVERRIVVYQVFRGELDAFVFRSESNSMTWALFGILFGAAIASGLAAWWPGFILCGLLSICFAFVGLAGSRKQQRAVDIIKAGTIQ